MPLALTAIRAGLQVLPPPLRERAAVRLFMTQRRHAEPARETAWRERGEEVLVAGHHATVFGEGRPAFLMHGWEGRGLQLANFIEPLIERGHRVYALDGPDHGRNHGGVGALPTFAAFLEEAIHELGPSVIVAHSLGSAAAIVAAARTGYEGAIVCLGGPPETHQVFTRARAFMGLPESGRERFMTYLADAFDGVRVDDVMDIEAQARACHARLSAVLARDDDDIPAAESRRIIEAGGGTVQVLDDVDHRSVMWKPHAVGIGLSGL